MPVMPVVECLPNVRTGLMVIMVTALKELKHICAGLRSMEAWNMQ